MTTWTPPAPPVQTVWWDPVVTLANVLARLRLTGTDIDKVRVEALIPVAGYQINERLDRTTEVTVLAGPGSFSEVVPGAYIGPVGPVSFVEVVPGAYATPTGAVVGSFGQVASLQDALESLTIALYLPPVQNLDGTYVNPVDTVAGQITPSRQRWGVA